MSFLVNFQTIFSKFQNIMPNQHKRASRWWPSSSSPIRYRRHIDNMAQRGIYPEERVRVQKRQQHATKMIDSVNLFRPIDPRKS
jgi:hypothetical protein